MLSRLSDDTAPKWGILTPQHMVEHLVSSWRISNGKAQAPCITPEERLSALRQFLFSDKPFQKNIKNPILPEGLTPLRKKNLEEANQQLVNEIRDFFAYFEEHPNSKPIHPIFGELDKEGWLLFQEKHIKHHFEQFGLL